MDANEARVRDVWERHMTWVQIRPEAGVINGFSEIYKGPVEEFPQPEAAAWSAAAAYTETVVEEARQLLREMHHVECLFGRPPESLIRESVEEDWPENMTMEYVREICAYSRILARLESAYAAHIRGIKPEVLR